MLSDVDMQFAVLNIHFVTPKIKRRADTLWLRPRRSALGWIPNARDFFNAEGTEDTEDTEERLLKVKDTERRAPSPADTCPDLAEFVSKPVA